MKEKIGTVKEKLGNKTYSFKPIEDVLDLQSMVSLRLGGRRVGAYLLKKNHSRPYSLVFGFQCRGIHSFLDNDEIETAFNTLEAGLKDLPTGEALTIHLGAIKSDRERQEHLEALANKAPSTELKFLVKAERARVQELARSGHREPKVLRLYATFTAKANTTENADWVERAIAEMERFFASLQGRKNEWESTQLEDFLRHAFTSGYLNWEQILFNKLGLKVRPMNEDELWSALWYRFNVQNEPDEIPQLLILDKHGLRESVRHSLHATTLLFQDSLPNADRKWMHIDGYYYATHLFVEKPGGWRDKSSQLHYIWDVIARDLVTDTEVFCQIVPANPTLVKTAVQRLIKQNAGAASRAKEKRNVDVAAQVNTRRSVDAQEKMYTGDVPFHVGVALVVRRKSLRNLDEACQALTKYFQRPAWVMRECEIAWKLWLQTLPVVQEYLLSVPLANRRQVYLSSELPGLMPVLNTISRDTEGLELIGEDGGTPIFLNPFGSDHRNISVYGTTRSGKSVLVSGILTQGLVRRIPIVALDYPKPDGTSTFTDYTNFLGDAGGYFDIGQESMNLFERPNLSALARQTQIERFDEYKEFLSGCLLAMVIGEATNQDELMRQTIRTVLHSLINQFFGELTILNRFDAAEAGGLGTSAWQDIPTLKDFVPLCTVENLNQLVGLDGNYQQVSQDEAASGQQIQWSLVPRAMEQIRLMLNYWINSRIGQAISSPSTVSSNADLLVFALRQVTQSVDAAILALVAYAASMRRALGSPISIFFIDESPILFAFPEISRQVGRICANGAKSGIRVFLTAQSPVTIAKSVAAADILQNINTRLVGRIEAGAIPSYVDTFQWRREVVAQCSRFEPSKVGMFSRWLLDDIGIQSIVRYYPSYIQLAMVANNSDEQAARKQYMEAYPNKYQAISAFGKALLISFRGGVRIPTPQEFEAYSGGLAA